MYYKLKTSFVNFQNSLSIQRRAIFAIYFREMLARFGKYNWGFLWAFLEPLVHVTALSTVFYFAARQTYSMDFPVFVTSGILPWLLFKNVLNKVVNAVSANSGLFFYANVKPLDTILARAFLELNLNIYVTIFLSLLMYLLKFDMHFDDFVLYVATMISLFFFALGLGIIAAVFNSFYDDVSKVLAVMMRPLYFVTGIFFSIDIVPERFQEALLLNPILHAVHLVRNSFYSGFHSDMVSLGYLATCACISMCVGMFYYNLNYRRIVDK